MGAFSGPKVVDDGLVFSLDGANYKSFKGEATTNEIVSVTWWGDGSNQASFVKGVVLITDENLKYNGYETYLWSPGTSNNCYLNGGDLSTGRTSTVWTFSCYIKRQDGAPITSLNVYMYYPSSDGYATGTIQDVGNGWYRVSRTRTGTNNYLSLIGFTGFVTGYKYYLSGAQLEKKSYPTTVVATNTTRGTTVATGGGWADLTGNGNHGELVNGVRESSDNLGALVFDGTDDYVTTTLGTYTPYCIDIWFYNDDSITSATMQGNYQQLLGVGSSPGGIALGSWTGSATDETFSFFSAGWSANGMTYIRDTASPGIHNLVVNWNGSSFDFWLDGTKRTTYASSYGHRTLETVTGFQIGSAYNNANSYEFDGSVYSVKVYISQLTDAQVQQNFNATRSRFGI